LAFSYWIDNLGFITEGKLPAIFIKPSLGVSNWPVIYIINYTPICFLAPFITAPSGASTKHSAGATILNGTGIKVKSDAITRVDDLTTRKELHVKLRNMHNRRNMKRGSTKNASTNDWEGVPSAVRTQTGESTG
jgi:hypothetical protein